MSENTFIAIIVLMTIAIIILLARDISKFKPPSSITWCFTLTVLAFAIAVPITYNVEIGTQYVQKSSNPFKPAIVREVIDISDGYVQYVYITNDCSVTNSASIQDFYNSIEK